MHKHYFNPLCRQTPKYLQSCYEQLYLKTKLHEQEQECQQRGNDSNHLNVAHVNPEASYLQLFPDDEQGPKGVW